MRSSRRSIASRACPKARDRTFFEVSTALAFLDFAARGVEWAVVEVGWAAGSTAPTCSTPEISAITSIGLDHTEILGDTLEAIAAEKAGIIKPGVPVVSGVTEPGPRAVIERIAAENDAPLIVVGAPLPAAGGEAPVLRVNRAPRARGAGPGRPARRAGLAGGPPSAASPPPAGRDASSVVPRCPICGGTAPTIPTARHTGPRPAAGASGIGPGASRDKTPEPCSTPSNPSFPNAAWSRPAAAASGPRPGAIAGIARGLGWEAAIAPDVPAPATARAPGAGEGALLTGSLFAVGEAMESFGGAPGEML
jgi:nucleotide-binding universal stress UspA family protein